MTHDHHTHSPDHNHTHTGDDPDALMMRAQRLLKAAGYKLTGPRLVILTVFTESTQHGGHLTSGELLSRVEAHDAGIGRASVFRTLELLARLGIIATTVHGGAQIRYALMPEGHHHHMICTRCQSVTEFDQCSLGALTNQLHQEYGFSSEGHLLEVYGICRSCIGTALQASQTS